MSNKYQSNVRTFVARNLIWNSGGAFGTGAVPAGLYALNPPATIQISNADCVLQPFRANWPLSGDWSLTGNINIKRVGLFSNFADGLVLSDLDTRLALTIRAAVFTNTPYAGTTMVFTEGNCLVTGTNWNLASIVAGNSYFVADGVGRSYMYELTGVVNLGAGNYSGRLSDYAYRTATVTVNKLVYPTYYLYKPVIIPTLNTMYEMEAFFNANLASESTTKFSVLVCAVNILGSGEMDSDSVFNLYPKTIDTAFATVPVTFDCAIEVEITSLAPSVP